MNKIVKQISEQACEYANETWKPRVRSKVPGEIWEEGHVDWFEQYDAKFAQLIVRECLNQCYYRGMNDELYEGQLNAASYIEQHFGVEE